MHRISLIPRLRFDQEALEAARFYASVFPDSKVIDPDLPADTGVVRFELGGQPFQAVNAGLPSSFNPSVSFMVNFDPSRMDDARGKLDAAWGKLSEGGKALMPIDKYFFSERYGWIQDRYGISWQLILTSPEGEPRPLVMPSLMFIEHNNGKAEEARNFYTSVFRNARKGALERYGKEPMPDMEGLVMFSDFRLGDTWFVAMDSGHMHGFNFNEAVSFLVECEDPSEVDAMRQKLSAAPKGEPHGWVKDKFGLSWQVGAA